MVQCDAIRSLAPGYPEHGAFPDPVTRVIDDERRQQFMAGGRPFRIGILSDAHVPAAGGNGRACEGLDVRGWRRVQQQQNGGSRSLTASAAGWMHLKTSSAQLFQTERLKRITVADDCGC